MSAKKKNGFSYDKAVARLDEILLSIQEGKIPLDQFEEVLKEAKSLVDESRQHLRGLQDTINHLVDDHPSK